MLNVDINIAIAPADKAMLKGKPGAETVIGVWESQGKQKFLIYYLQDVRGYFMENSARYV